MNERIKWIDIAKCFGMYGIYVLHFGELAGRSYPFLLTHVVPLFFLTAGCMENYNKETSFLKYFVKKIKTIMIPFWVFAIIAAVITFVYCNYDSMFVSGMIMEVGLGVIRNSFPAASLWFLTCLFVMQLMFFFIKRFRLKALILAVCFVLYMISINVLDPSPLWRPSWPYNVDSAFFYIICYAIGYVAFPYVVKLFELDTKAKRIGFGISGVLAVVYSIYAYLGIDLFSYLPFVNVMVIILPILSSCVVIWGFFVIARLVEDVDIFSKIGRNTLYLCGCEYVVKTLGTCFFAIIGYELFLPNPLSVYIYSAILIVFANKYIVPIEKYIINKIVK